jgi:hypothetical protein
MSNNPIKRTLKRPAPLSISEEVDTGLDLSDKTVEYYKNLFFTKMKERQMKEREDKQNLAALNRQLDVLLNAFESIYSKLISNKNVEYEMSNECNRCFENYEKGDYTCVNNTNILFYNSDYGKVANELEIYSDDSERGKDSTHIFNLIDTTVCRKDDKILKKIRFFKSDTNRNNGNIALFILIWEITLQNYVNQLTQTDAKLTNLKVPLIIDYFLNEKDNVMEVLMIMEYIDTVPLEFPTKYEDCIRILVYLKTKYNIFHNDTHNGNIKQTSDGEQIVLLDWGKGTIGKGQPSTSGIYSDMTAEDFKNWLHSSEQLKTGEYGLTSMPTEIFGGKITKKVQKQRCKKTKRYKNRTKHKKNKNSKEKKSKRRQNKILSKRRKGRT